MGKDRKGGMVASRRSPLIEQPRSRIGWTAEEAAEILEMPAKTLHTWATVGLVEPTAPADVDEVDRSGVKAHRDDYPRAWSLSDLLRARIARDLLEEKVDRQVVRQIVRCLAGLEPWAPDVRRLAVRGWTVCLTIDPDVAKDIAKRAPGDDGWVHWFDPHQVARLIQDGECDLSGRWPGMVDDTEDRTVVGVLYPEGEVAQELVESADAWLRARGERPSQWM